MIGLLAFVVNSADAEAVDCLSSAAAVKREYPQARPSWTLRASGHEGSKCWYGATQRTANDHQPETAITEPTLETQKAVASPQETYGFASRPLSEVVPDEAVPSALRDSPASFAERFSGAYGGSLNTESAGTRPLIGIYNPQ
jgi:hypothetical protein